jgi:hypothetical protein
MSLGPTASIGTVSLTDLGGFGCNYDEDMTSLKKSESPNAIDIEFDETLVRKRRGFRSITDATGTSDQGYALYNFGNDDNVQKLMSHQGNVVYTMDNLNGTQASLRTSVPRVQSYFASVAGYVIHTFNDHSTEYYWDGTAGTMSILSGDAPGFKHTVETAGYLLGGNISGEPLRIYYEDTNSMIGGTYTEYFTLSGGRDDEITGFFIHNGRTYATTTSAVFRISFVGGVTVWEFKKVINTTGAVTRTAKVVATDELGEIVLMLGYDLNIYLFNGSVVRIISDKYRKPNNDTPIALAYMDRGKIENCNAVYDVVGRTYRLFVTKKGDDTNEYCLNIDVRNFSYYPYQNMLFASSTIAQDGIGRLFLVGADYVGKIHKLFIEVNDDDGVVIVENYEAPPLYKALEKYKKVETMDLHFSPAGYYKLQYDDRTDFDKTWNPRTQVPMYNTRDRYLGENFVLGTSGSLGSDVSVLGPHVNIPVTNNIYRFRLHTNGTEGEVCRYKTGTVAGSGGGTSITGTSTAWTSDMTAANGWKIWVEDGEHKNYVYDFTYVSATSATVSTMTGTSPADDFTGASYEVYKTGDAACAYRWELLKIDYNIKPLSVGKGTKLR